MQYDCSNCGNPLLTKFPAVIHRTHCPHCGCENVIVTYQSQASSKALDTLPKWARDYIDKLNDGELESHEYVELIMALTEVK